MRIMNKYKVTLKEISKFHVVVEAEELEDAIEKAYEIYNYGCPMATSDVEVTSVEKVEGDVECTITQ